MGLLRSSQGSRVGGRSDAWRSEPRVLEDGAVMAFHEVASSLGLDVTAVLIPDPREIRVAGNRFSCEAPLFRKFVVEFLVNAAPNKTSRVGKQSWVRNGHTPSRKVTTRHLKRGLQQSCPTPGVYKLKLSGCICLKYNKYMVDQNLVGLGWGVGGWGGVGMRSTRVCWQGLVWVGQNEKSCVRCTRSAACVGPSVVWVRRLYTSVN